MFSKNYRDWMEELLSEEEKILVEQFANNEKMKEAVRKIILFPIYHAGTLRAGKKPRPDVNWAQTQLLGMSNEALADVTRATLEALNRLEEGFDSLSLFRKIDKGTEKKNPAI